MMASAGETSSDVGEERVMVTSKRKPSKEEIKCRNDIQKVIEKLFDTDNFTKDERLYSLVTNGKDRWIALEKFTDLNKFAELREIVEKYDFLRKDNSLSSYLQSLNNSKFYQINNDKDHIRVSAKSEKKVICDIRNHFETYFNDQEWCKETNLIHNLKTSEDGNGWFSMHDIGYNLQKDETFSKLCQIDDYRLHLLLESFEPRALRTYLEWNKEFVTNNECKESYESQLQAIETKLKDNFKKRKNIQYSIDDIDLQLRRENRLFNKKSKEKSLCQSIVDQIKDFQTKLMNNNNDNNELSSSQIRGFCYVISSYKNNCFGTFNQIHKLFSNNDNNDNNNESCMNKIDEWLKIVNTDMCEIEKAYDALNDSLNQLNEEKAELIENGIPELETENAKLMKKEKEIKKSIEDTSIDQTKRWQFRRRYIHSQTKIEIRNAIENFIKNNESNDCQFDFEQFCRTNESLSKLKAKYWFEIGRYSWFDICYYSICYSPLCNLYFDENEAKWILSRNEKIQVSSEMLQRDWIDIHGNKMIDSTQLLHLFSSNVEFNNVCFSVMSYNILADSLFKSDMYPWTTQTIQNWQNRKFKIIGKIEEYKPDIICLQEVEKQHYYSFFKPILEKNANVAMPNESINNDEKEDNKSKEKKQKQGKKSKFEATLDPIIESDEKMEESKAQENEKEKETERTLEYNSKYLGTYSTFYIHKTKEYGSKRMTQEPIGNMIAIDNEKYNIIDCLKIKLVDLSKRCKSNILKKRYGLSQVGLCVLIQSKTDLSKEILVATTHICAAYKTPDVQIMQMCEFLSKINVFHSKLKNSKNIPIIICGDFNIKPNSGCYQLIKNGQLSTKHCDLQNISNNETLHSIKMPVNSINSQNMTKTKLNLNNEIHRASNNENNIHCNKFELPFNPPYHHFGQKLLSCYYQCLRKHKESLLYKHEMNDSKQKSHSNQFEKTEPFFTNLIEKTEKNGAKFSGCLDYIWYTNQMGIECLGVLQPISEKMATIEYALPNQFEPSDHIPIMSLFSWNDTGSYCEKTIKESRLQNATIAKAVQAIDRCIHLIDNQKIV